MVFGCDAVARKLRMSDLFPGREAHKASKSRDRAGLDFGLHFSAKIIENSIKIR